MIGEPDDRGYVPNDQPPVQDGELNHLYALLPAEDRDELLQCLLIAAPRGGEAMIEVLEDLFLVQAAQELIDGLPAEKQAPSP